MIEPMTREEGAKYLTEFLARLRNNRPPPRVESVAPPIDFEELWALAPGVYEGWPEDLKRMRRGLEPLGPRE
jgi:hypothetical protein